jgi:hypothetical protein
MGIGIQGTVYGDTWAHAVPRVYTDPDHVFTAHNGENLALACWGQGVYGTAPIAAEPTLYGTLLLTGTGATVQVISARRMSLVGHPRQV